MFCMNCGRQINDNATNCPYCGVEIREGNVHDNNHYYNAPPSQSYAINKSLIIKILIIVILVIVVAIAGAFALLYRSSDAGKLMRSRKCVDKQNYEKAYELIQDIPGEKARVYQEYISLMQDMKHLCAYANNNSEIDETLFQIENRIKNNIMPNKKGFLKKNEEEKLTSILSNIESYDNNLEKVKNMKTNMQKACSVYTQFDTFDSGRNVNPTQVKENAVEWQNALEQAKQSYTDIMATEDMPFYYNTMKAIKFAQNEMIDTIEKFGENSTVHYTDGFIYEGKKCTEDDIQELEYNMKRQLIKNNFSKYYDVVQLGYTKPTSPASQYAQ